MLQIWDHKHANKHPCSNIMLEEPITNTLAGKTGGWLFFYRIIYAIIYIGIKHGFPCINICQVPREVLKTEVEDRGF